MRIILCAFLRKEREMKQEYGATYAVVDGEFTVTHVFPVQWDWDGFRFVGYCRPTTEEITDAGYNPDADADPDEYNAQGYDALGYDRMGVDRQGFDCTGRYTLED
jgi:hypothetical protein